MSLGRTSALSISALLPVRGPVFLASLVQCRCCHSSQAPRAKRFRPHQLGSERQREDVLLSPTASPATASASSSVQLTADSFEPPSALSAETVVEYLAALRGLHRSLGVTQVASKVRWRARTFLTSDMPNFLLRKPHELWTMTEDFACAIVVSCAHFEVSLSECPYGRSSGEFLHALWQKRLSSCASLSSPLCSCGEAVLLGQITLALLGQLSSRFFRMTREDHLLWSQLLCGALLPGAVCLLQDEALLVSPKGGGMTNAQATAFTVLLSALTKAAVTRWAWRDEESLDAQNGLVFGTPALLLSEAKERQSFLSTVHFKAPLLSLVKLVRVVQSYAASLITSLQVKETALPVLRFFTLTQCVPLFVVPHNGSDTLHCDRNSETGACIASLVASIARVLQLSIEHRVVFVSYQVANVASIYARILLFRPKEDGEGGGATDGKSASGSTSWNVFEGLMLGLQGQIFSHVETLSPVSVMLQLCEGVTTSANKYLFSDFAAVLSALSKIFSVVCARHIDSVTQQRARQQRQQEDQDRDLFFPRKEDNAGSEQLLKGSSKATHSRFVKRRTNVAVHETKQVQGDPLHSFSSLPLPSSSLELLSPSVFSSSRASFLVSSDDIAEIEGELEVLLDACVAVMEKYILSSCKSRMVFVAQPGAISSSSLMPSGPQTDNGDDNNTGVKDEVGSTLARVGASQAKALGGRSRMLKKTIASRELVMIAESVHALSWRPFMAFQERLLLVLLSELGQSELTSTQYACLVCLLLRSPPALPSVIFHSLGDRLKRIIHAEAVTVTSLDGEREGDNNVMSSITTGNGNTVIAAAHASSLQDQPLSLYDACAVVFAFSQKMRGTALPLLHDLLVRCGMRVLGTDISSKVCKNSAITSALTMFLASATWALTHVVSTMTESHVVRFITTSRNHAASVLVTLLDEWGKEGKKGFAIADTTSSTSSSAVPLLFSIRDMAYVCMMLETCDSQCGAHVMQVRHYLREVYMDHASRWDSIEVAQFVSDFLSIAPQRTPSCVDADGEDSAVATLQLSPWMISSLRLGERCASNRLSTLMFLPLLGDGHDGLAHALEVTRLYCRTFATLVTILRVLRATDTALLTNETLFELVLRKVEQLTRRTARPLELFQFFELYGDTPAMVSACLNELVAEAPCFTAFYAFIPVVQVNAAVGAVRRLRARALRQRWFTTMTPLIVSAVSHSREPLDVVLELTEHIGADDPELLQAVLKSSACMRTIHETFSFTASGAVLLRLLLQLQSSGNMSHPTVRRLQMALRRLLQSDTVHVSLGQLAQTMLLPSVVGTTLGRRLNRLFVFRLEKLLGTTRPRSGRFAGLAGVKNEGKLVTRQHSHWDESLNQLELEHWLALLRFSHIAEPSSYRFLMTIKQSAKDTAYRIGGNSTTATTSATEDTRTALCSRGPVDLSLGVEGAEGSDLGDTIEKRYRSLLIVFAFSESTIFSLRQSLGAFGFIAFVSELLRQTSRMKLKPSCSQQSALFEGGCMYDGSVSPLFDERVRPFVQLANSLVEEMSTNLGDFLQRERSQHREFHQRSVEQSVEKETKEDEKKEEVAVDVGAVLEYLRVLEAHNPGRREQQLLQSLSSSSLPGETLDVFDDSMRIPQRHLYRLLLQLPKYWGGMTSFSTPDEMVSVRLKNISSVFDYCAAPNEYRLSFGATNSWAETRRCLSSVFGTSRPLISDVWMSFSKVQSRQDFIDKTMKARLFSALMCCLMRDGESLAVTRARFATLGPRDLACVAQACLCPDTDLSNANDGSDKIICDGRSHSHGDMNGHKDDSWLRSRRRCVALSAIELLTDMLPSTTAEDLYDVVMALLPPSLANEQGDSGQSLTLFYGKEAVMEVRRFLAHVAVVMGNDTERFPLPMQLLILQRLHEPHRLVAPAAAQMMLTNLHASDDAAEPQLQRPHESENMTEERVVEGGASGAAAKKGHYAAIVFLLRSIVSSSS